MMSDIMENQQRVQMMIQELQMVAQQSAALRNQQREIEVTIEQVDKQPEDLSLYRQTGAILSEVGDRVELLSELHETGEKISQALEQLAQRETELRQSYEKMAAEFEGK
jgi:chaperonin cofactor prefoldin